jgi:hypothetical protein
VPPNDRTELSDEREAQRRLSGDFVFIKRPFIYETTAPHVETRKLAFFSCKLFVARDRLFED